MGHAQPAAPAPAATTVAESGTSNDSETVFRSYAVLLEQERARNLWGGLGSAAVGLAAIGVGGVLAERTDLSFTPWLVGGSTLAGLGLMAAFIPGPVEELGATFTLHGPHTPEQALALERDWRRLAQKAQRNRVVGSIAGLSLGVLALAGGGLVLSGVGDFERDNETLIGSVLLGSGTLVALGGATGFFLRSPVETSYAQYVAGKPGALQVRPLLSAGPAGFVLGASGAF